MRQLAYALALLLLFGCTSEFSETHESTQKPILEPPEEENATTYCLNITQECLRDSDCCQDKGEAVCYYNEMFGKRTCEFKNYEDAILYSQTGDALKWIASTDPDARVITWWDTGKAVEKAGLKSVVKYPSKNALDTLYMPDPNTPIEPEEKLSDVLDAFLSTNESDAKRVSLEYGADYILFDHTDLSRTASMNYLYCLKENRTQKSTMLQSECEKALEYEHMLIPSKPTDADLCKIRNLNATMAYAASSFGRRYCVTNAELQNKPVVLLYELNQSSYVGNLEIGQLRLIKAKMLYLYPIYKSGEQYVHYMVLYPEKWYDGTSGLADKTGEFYDTNFYKGYFLGRLDGFELVYPTNSSGDITDEFVRVFKLKR